ncbi:MAG: hypothetical protein KIT14_22680 [bacterium]|nr:hypothetical protein [bacterium]
MALAIRTMGGITQAIVKTGISEATWHRWRRAGRIADPEAVFLVEDLTGIPGRQLAGMRVVQGGAPTPKRGKRGASQNSP